MGENGVLGETPDVKDRPGQRRNISVVNCLPRAPGTKHALWPPPETLWQGELGAGDWLLGAGGRGHLQAGLDPLILMKSSLLMGSPQADTEGNLGHLCQSNQRKGSWHKVNH